MLRSVLYGSEAWNMAKKIEYEIGNGKMRVLRIHTGVAGRNTQELRNKK